MNVMQRSIATRSYNGLVGKSRTLKAVALVSLALLLSGCRHGDALRVSMPADARAPEAGATFLLIRHAEKAANDTKDPDLDDAGRARAQRLAERLRDTRFDAVYATGYRRTQQTAAPMAAMQGLTVRNYDAALPASQFAAQLRQTHPRGRVLVVGHSNTIPAIASALCGCPVAPIRDDEYDRLIEISFDRAATDAEARTRSVESRFD